MPFVPFTYTFCFHFPPLSPACILSRFEARCSNWIIDNTSGFCCLFFSLSRHLSSYHIPHPSCRELDLNAQFSPNRLSRSLCAREKATPASCVRYAREEAAVARESCRLINNESRKKAKEKIRRILIDTKIFLMFSCVLMLSNGATWDIVYAARRRRKKGKREKWN